MRLLFDLGHPAHVHLFRNIIKQVRKTGGDVCVTSRHKDVAVDLCRAYNIPQIVLSKARTNSFFSSIWEMAYLTLRLWNLSYRFRPDALLGTSASIGVIGRLIGRPSFFFGEDDSDVIPLFARMVYPTCSYIVTPNCLRHENYGIKHVTYPGYHELAYLHPDHFIPDPGVPRSIGLSIDEPYFILRFVALKAHHDVNAGGLPIGTLPELIQILSAHGKVLITSEKPLPPHLEKYRLSLPPEKFHDVLAYASICIGDSQTVAAEAAVLGVPNIRCNTFVGRISYLSELESAYGLTSGFLPHQKQEMFQLLGKWLKDLTQARAEMQLRRWKMLDETIDLANWQWEMISSRLNSYLSTHLKPV